MDAGLGDLGATLCSPLLTLPQVYITNALGVDNDTCQLMFTPLFADEPYTEFRPGKLFGLRNFPYGFDVVPDVPL